VDMAVYRYAPDASWRDHRNIASTHEEKTMRVGRQIQVAVGGEARVEKAEGKAISGKLDGTVFKSNAEPKATGTFCTEKGQELGARPKGGEPWCNRGEANFLRGHLGEDRRPTYYRRPTSGNGRTILCPTESPPPSAPAYKKRMDLKWPPIGMDLKCPDDTEMSRRYGNGPEMVRR